MPDHLPLKRYRLTRHLPSVPAGTIFTDPDGGLSCYAPYDPLKGTNDTRIYVDAEIVERDREWFVLEHSSVAEIAAARHSVGDDRDRNCFYEDVLLLIASGAEDAKELARAALSTKGE